MTDILLVLAGVLLAVTFGVAVEYFRQLRRIQEEYEEAKGVVEDIVVSFNRQLEREAEKLEMAAYKIEANSSKSDRALKGDKEIRDRLSTLEQEAGAIMEERGKTKTKLDKMVKKVDDVMRSYKPLMAKVSDLERKAEEFSRPVEPKIEAVIPIKRDEALAPLTKTELSVLEILALEGAKTAPKIRNRIKLSREHTARLMKKLYDAGYLERDTSKTPFNYWIKEEMENLLKKSGVKA